MNKASTIIDKLQLQPLAVEGGFFHETYRSVRKTGIVPARIMGTSIYYLLKKSDKSDWHQVASDEIWYYHAGAPAIQLLLFQDGSWEERKIGGNVEAGQVPQSVIPAGTWQAAVLDKDSEYDFGLFGAAVFPGFEYDDFIAGNSMELSKQYPEAAKRLKELGL
jgi:predicted cupin superfamily sugar epimerase